MSDYDDIDNAIMARIRIYPTQPYRSVQPLLLSQDVPMSCVRFRKQEDQLTMIGSTITFMVYDPDNKNDFEGDPCQIVRAEFHSPTDAGLGRWPDVDLQGYLEKIHWATSVNPDSYDGGNAYLPKPLDGWKPGMYRLSVLVRSAAGLFDMDLYEWDRLVCPACGQDRACHSEPCEGDPRPYNTTNILRWG